MRINRITVENFQGARAVDLQLPTRSRWCRA